MREIQICIGDGEVRDALARLAAGKRPLVGETRRLSTEIFREAERDHLLVDPLLVHAAVRQFGARKGRFGTTRRGAPIPWGDIPARPFLGISDEDARTMLAVPEAFVRRDAGGQDRGARVPPATTDSLAEFRPQPINVHPRPPT